MTEPAPATADTDDYAKEFAHCYLRKVKRRQLEAEDFKGVLGGGDYKQWEHAKAAWEASSKLRSESNLIRTRWYENQVADDLADELISRHFPKAAWKLRRFLKDELKEYFDTYDEWDAKYAVEHVRAILKEGMPGLQKRQRASKHYWRRSFRHGWTVVKNLVGLVVVLAILNVASSRFETLALSLLVLIYLRVLLFAHGLGIAHGKSMLALDAEFRRLRALVNDEPSQDENDVLKTANEQMWTQSVDSAITAGFSSIVFAIVLWYLWSAS
jgi:hypothetical protein